MKSVKLRIWTIGHSNRLIEDFIALLHGHKIELVADVRRFPSSRRYPHFNQPEMERSLAEHGIGYMHFPDLGGRRVPRRDSQNSLWRNEGFRGYADYMGTPAFQTAIGQLEQLTSARRTAVLCAEALWWQCHRMLIADYLKVSGAEVLHILNSAKAEEHTYTQPARIVEGKLTYIIPQPELQLNLKTEE